jgi:FkbM family methyltransferase
MKIQNRFMFSKILADRVKQDPFVLIDVGARGALDLPWQALDSESLRVIGFEPDDNECKRLNIGQKNRVYFPYALWSEPGKVTVHVASTPSCSSVHPPNMDVIRKFEEKHWRPRQTQHSVSMNATTLEQVFSKESLYCDFLKIDTQGSEYEILEGAGAALEKNIFAVLVETWTTEVHQGQHLSGEVLALMARQGFELFDVNVAAAWRRKANTALQCSGKPQVIGLDFLFFNKRLTLDWLADKNGVKLAKAAAIADIFGFPDYAIELLSDAIQSMPEDKYFCSTATEIILADSKQRKTFFAKVKRKLGHLLGKRMEDFPSLHY